jgi:uncharacterized repeat protein (TIGR03843 family)
MSTDVLGEGEVVIEGRMPWSSNATFLVRVELGDQATRGIYKPHRGERPLWDFPSGLYKREVAAFELAQVLGWQVVPRTVLREGPYGIGSIQQFVDAKFEEHYFTLLEKPEQHDALRAIGVFDILANNADRKGGHCLVDGDGIVWAIDNGLCFHTEPKLRTVIWDFCGQRIPSELLDDVERVAEAADDELGALPSLLDEDELEAVRHRARRLVRRPVFPEPRSGHPYPWPLV